MHFKIFLLLITLSNSQTFFNKTIGNDNIIYSPRTIGLGNNIGHGALDAYALFGNPSNLINENEDFTFILNSNVENLNERRSFILKDSFGDFLTEADYIVNKNRRLNTSSGFTYNKVVNKHLFAFGFSFSPVIDFSSNYLEEVRGKVDCEDLTPCTRDVLSGYQQFNTDGTINGLSVGIATIFKTMLGNIKIGLSHTSTLNSTIDYEILIDTLHNEWTNLSQIQSEKGSVSVEPSNSLNYGMTYDSNIGVVFSLFYRSPIKFRSDGLYPFGYLNEASGLIEYNIPCDNHNCTNNVYQYKFDLNVPQFQTPQKIGISLGYRPVSNQRTAIFFELIENKYDNIMMGIFRESSQNLDTDNYRFSTSNELKFGLEYGTYSNSSIRTGFSLVESPVPGVKSQSKISFGYGKRIEKITIDFGLSYFQNYYNYPDIFPILDDPRPDFDSVKESNYSLSTAIRYSF